MSVTAIRAALETALSAMSPALSYAWENVPFSPTTGTPYARVHLLLARPDNSEISRDHVEQGLLQVTLLYPLNTGSAAAAARAELIRTTFYRGASFVSGGITVTVTKTPEIGPAMVDGDRFALPVSISFLAPVTG